MKDKLILPILILVLNAVEINAREFSSYLKFESALKSTPMLTMV